MMRQSALYWSTYLFYMFKGNLADSLTPDLLPEKSLKSVLSFPHDKKECAIVAGSRSRIRTYVSAINDAPVILLQVQAYYGNFNHERLLVPWLFTKPPWRIGALWERPSHY